MGRYTTVQSFADNNQRVAPLPYEKASGGIKADPDARAPGVRVQIVQNVSGSTAGAGSSHFHVYRLERRREEERVKNMDESHEAMARNQEYHAQLEANRLECEARTLKRAEKRRRAKASKSAGVKKHETGALDGVRVGREGDGDEDDDGEGVAEAAGLSSAAAPAESASVLDRDDLLLDDGKFVERFLLQRSAESASVAPESAVVPPSRTSGGVSLEAASVDATLVSAGGSADAPSLSLPVA